MEMYNEVLEKVAEKELYFSIFWVVVLFLIIVIVWVCNYLYFKKMKNRHPKKYNSNKQIKIRRQSFYASIILTVLCVCLGIFFIFGAAYTISDIDKDIEENTYITYIGGYYVDSEYMRHALYDRYLTVTFENNDYAILYMNSFFEWISTDKGSFDGTVVYGKNSLIVVDIES